MNQTNTRRTDIPLTLRKSVKDAFAERGLSISGWARKHNLAPQYVYDLLNAGRTGRGVNRTAPQYSSASRKASSKSGRRHDAPRQPEHGEAHAAH